MEVVHRVPAGKDFAPTSRDSIDPKNKKRNRLGIVLPHRPCLFGGIGRVAPSEYRARVCGTTPLDEI